MGAKIDQYIDDHGNIVSDGDKVLYNDKEYEVIYISHQYVNLSGNGGLHLPFCNGIPSRKIANAPEKPKLWRDMTPEEKGALLLAAHEGKVIEYYGFTLSDEWYACDGKPYWCNGNAYRIKPHPKIETVTLYGRPDVQWVLERCKYDDHRITFQTIDGKPDCTSIKMEAI